MKIGPKEEGSRGKEDHGQPDSPQVRRLFMLLFNSVSWTCTSLFPMKGFKMNKVHNLTNPTELFHVDVQLWIASSS